MGRGGGGGGGHHSSHHSSSHSHHASSSHSYSSGSSSSHHSGRTHYSNGSGGGGGGGGCSSFIALLIIAIIGLGAYTSVKGELPGPLNYFLIERSTVVREKLPENKCQKYDEWYQDDWGDWIDETGEEAALISGMNFFYDQTGVQPYLWITGEEGGQYKSEQSVEDLAEEKYKEMFGNDEGHVLIIFRKYPNNSSEYICVVTPGYDAETQIMDVEAREILLDFMDYYYTDDNLNEGQFFAKAFEKAGERIMMKQLTWKQMGIIAAVAVIFVIGIVIVANIAKKRKIAVAKQKTLQAQEAARQAQAVAEQKQTDFNRKQYEDHLETQYVAVSCPNCGSSGNKIRKTTVGYCAYCGTAIKVDENGNVTIISGDSNA